MQSMNHEGITPQQNKIPSVHVPSVCKGVLITAMWIHKPQLRMVQYEANTRVFDAETIKEDNANDFASNFPPINEHYFRECKGKRHIISELFTLLIRSVQEVSS